MQPGTQCIGTIYLIASNIYSNYLLSSFTKEKFIYSKKAKIFCEISTVDLSYVVPVKSSVEISKNFVAFSEYMNFIMGPDKQDLMPKIHIQKENT